MTEADKKTIAEIATKHGMTKKQLIKRLNELAESAEGWEWNKDGESPEGTHVKADRALLEYIGDEAVSKAFNGIKKWYA